MFTRKRCGCTLSLALPSLMCIAAFSLTGCGDDSTSVPPSTTGGGGGGTSEAMQPVKSKIKTVSATANPTDIDRFLGMTTDSRTGNVYAVGWRKVTATDSEIIVAKFNAEGTQDLTFGASGFARVNATPGGTDVEIARGVVVQSDGKIVVSGVADHDPTAAAPLNRDTDVVLARFDTNGTLDTTFGNAVPPNGVARLDLSDGVVIPPTPPSTTSSVRGDTSWGLAVLSNNKLVVSAAKVSSVPGRTDKDHAIVQLTANGLLDTTFGGGDGIADFDVANANVSEKTVTIQPGSSANDYKIVAVGYANNIPNQTGLQLLVAARLNPDGSFDTSFNGACATEAVPCPPGVTVNKYRDQTSEAYGHNFQSGNRLVFCGYGDPLVPTSPTKFVDAFSGRLTPNGAKDTSYGTNGLTLINTANFHDRCREVEVLSDDSLLHFGQSNPTETNQDAALYVLRSTGLPNTAFNPNGTMLFDFGGTSDAFFGATLSPDGKTAYAAGYKGFATTAQTPATNDDARLVVIPLSPGGM